MLCTSLLEHMKVGLCLYCVIGVNVKTEVGGKNNMSCLPSFWIIDCACERKVGDNRNIDLLCLLVHNDDSVRRW